MLASRKRSRHRRLRSMGKHFTTSRGKRKTAETSAASAELQESKYPSSEQSLTKTNVGSSSNQRRPHNTIMITYLIKKSMKYKGSQLPQSASLGQDEMMHILVDLEADIEAINLRRLRTSHYAAHFGRLSCFVLRKLGFPPGN